MPQTAFSVPADQPERINRRPLDGPVIAQRASQPGRCVTCQRRYPRGTRITWLDGSGPCHAEHAPASTQAAPMAAARFLASGAADAAELRGWLQMAGLIMAPPRRTARRRPA
jgi:hypothetical protein